MYLDTYGTSIFEISSSDNSKIQDPTKQALFKNKKALKLEIERSSTYIGYKILWIIKLFLDGKKFPVGSLTSNRWQYYVMDIVRFCTNERFMIWFLEFDSDAFFTVILKLFNDTTPFHFIKN